MADSASWTQDPPRSRRRAVLISLLAAFVLLIALVAALWLSGAGFPVSGRGRA